ARCTDGRTTGGGGQWLATAPESLCGSKLSRAWVCHFNPLILLMRGSPAGPTTHSFAPRDFPETSKRPALGGLRRRRFGLRGDLSGREAFLGRVVSGPRNPVSRKRRPSSAETRFECLYCAIKPSI